MSDDQGRSPVLSELRKHTPARIRLGHAGPALPTSAHLDFQLAHAKARDAVHQQFGAAALVSELARLGPPVLRVRSAVPDRQQFLLNPTLGRKLADESRAVLSQTGDDIGFVIGDGLSAAAVERHAPPLLALLLPRLESISVAPLVVADQARVALGDEIGGLLGVRMILVLIGERPGLGAPDTMGIYVTFDPRPGRTDAERNCISNVRPEGLDYPRAAHKLLWLIREGLQRRYTGIALKEQAGEPPGQLPC